MLMAIDYETDRARAAAIPIDGPQKTFALEVRRLLGWEPGSTRTFMTSRMASRKTGISHTTIGFMARGDRVTRATVERFARAMGEDPARLLQLATGDDNSMPLSAYHNAPKDIQETVDHLLAPFRNGPASGRDAAPTLPELTREAILDGLMVAAKNGIISDADMEQATRIVSEQRSSGYQGDFPGKKRQKTLLELDIEKHGDLEAE